MTKFKPENISLASRSIIYQVKLNQNLKGQSRAFKKVVNSSTAVVLLNRFVVKTKRLSLGLKYDSQYFMSTQSHTVSSQMSSGRETEI